MKTISHLVAVSNNLVIGVDNDLPWNLRADLAHFKKYTLNKIIIMGRKTFESIGKPLPNRINYVVSKTLNEIHGACVFNNLDEAISKAEKENNPKAHKGKKIGSIQRTKSGKPRMKARACYRSKKKANNAMAAAMMG